MKAWGAVLLAALMALALCGCRVRVTGAGDRPGGESGGERAGSVVSAEAETPDGDMGEPDGASGRTRDNPEAEKKEYDENAPAEIVAGTDRLLHGEGEGDASPRTDEEASAATDRIRDGAKDAATQTVAAEEADKMGVSEDGETAESAFTYYTVLLHERMGSLFECKRLSVYLETEEDHVTVHKSSPEHKMIADAGLYDVSARLLPENLRVDDGWVARKNPGVIVKLVDGSVLGAGASSDDAAREVCRGLAGREGWQDVDAVKNGRVLILSREMMDAPHLVLAAQVILAKMAAPELFEGVDGEKVIEALCEEAAGALPDGRYDYVMGE